MSKAFESIKAGLGEAIAHANGQQRGVRVSHFDPIDVKAIRAQVGNSRTDCRPHIRGVGHHTAHDWRPYGQRANRGAG